MLLLLAIAALLWWLLPAPARIEASSTSLEFDLTRVNSASEPRQAVLTNIGERALEVKELRFLGEGGEHYQLDGSGCVGSRVAAGETCSVGVTFRPLSRGHLPATLEVVANARNSPFSLALDGTAVAPRVGLAPERLDFGTTAVDGEVVTQTLTISNVGELPLELGRVKIEGPNAREFERKSRCPSTVLAPGDACSFPLTFAPAVAGERTAELVVQNDSPEGEARIPLLGVGLWEGPVLAVDPEGVDFGEQRVGSRSPAQVVRFRNPTPGPITVHDVVLKGDSAFSVDGGTCLDTRLDPGEGCRLEVVFAPVEEKRRRGELQVRARESEEAVQVSLRGLGVQPRLAVESESLSFGSTRTGLESATRAAVFLNSGTGTLRLRDVEVSGTRSESFRVRKDECSK
ncbi:MAG: choice-of-anchor D domain-containing protein, partial [Acidobacteriota bacterium]|nr:choice-of-anchor D domain-containing protein [Acidobacteriota bacterium]